MSRLIPKKQTGGPAWALPASEYYPSPKKLSKWDLIFNVPQAKVKAYPIYKRLGGDPEKIKELIKKDLDEAPYLNNGQPISLGEALRANIEFPAWILAPELTGVISTGLGIRDAADHGLNWDNGTRIALSSVPAYAGINKTWEFSRFPGAHAARGRVLNSELGKEIMRFEGVPEKHYMQTVYDANGERPVLHVDNKTYFFPTSQSKLTEGEIKGVPKGERNLPIKELSYYDRRLREGLENLGKVEQKIQKPYLEETFNRVSDPEILQNMRSSNKSYIRNYSDKFIEPFDDSDFSKLLQLYINLLDKIEIDPRIKSINVEGFEQPSLIVRGFRNYMNHEGYDISDISDSDLLKFLTHQLKDLSSNANGKLKNTILWHGSKQWFPLFDYTKVSENTGNLGAIGPGNYFSTTAAPYGGTYEKTILGYRSSMNNMQPYIVTNIKSTPDGSLMQEKGILPDFVSSKMLTPEILKKEITKIKPSDRAYIDFSEPNRGAYYTKGPISFMIQRNTGIKSLYPHPSRFIQNSDGIILSPTNWSDIRTNFKQGGRLIPKAQLGLKEQRIQANRLHKDLANQNWKEGNVLKAAYHWWKGTPGLGGQFENDYIYKTGIAPNPAMKPIGVSKPIKDGINSAIKLENGVMYRIKGLTKKGLLDNPQLIEARKFPHFEKRFNKQAYNVMETDDPSKIKAGLEKIQQLYDLFKKGLLK